MYMYMYITMTTVDNMYMYITTTTVDVMYMYITMRTVDNMYMYITMRTVDNMYMYITTLLKSFTSSNSSTLLLQDQLFIQYINIYIYIII